MGVMLCMVLSAWGSAWGTWRAGLGVCYMGVDHVQGIIKNIIPIVMAGVLGIYGLIVSVIVAQAIVPPGDANQYSTYTGYTHLAAGLCCGISCLAAGGTIGILGDIGVRAVGIKAEGGKKWHWETDEADFQEDRGPTNTESANKLYVGMIIMLIFSEALALYGLIVALILSQHNYECE